MLSKSLDAKSFNFILIGYLGLRERLCLHIKYMNRMTKTMDGKAIIDIMSVELNPTSAAKTASTAIIIRKDTSSDCSGYRAHKRFMDFHICISTFCIKT